jgi:AraC-like DNA-binding protein
MRFNKFPAPPHLQEYVRYFWLLEAGENDLGFSQMLFPFGSCELIFNLHEGPVMKTSRDATPSPQPKSLLAGQFTDPFLLCYPKPFRSAGVSLQPWASNLFAAIPAQYFTNKLTELAFIDPYQTLHERLCLARNEQEMISLLVAYVSEKLRSHKPDALASAIAKAISANPSDATYKDITSRIGFTRRRTEQRFIASTGLSMGTFVRKQRFQKAVHLLRPGKTISLTLAGLEAGYYDQSHFTRDFKTFSGITPGAFVKHQASFSNNVSEWMM